MPPCPSGAVDSTCTYFTDVHCRVLQRQRDVLILSLVSGVTGSWERASVWFAGCRIGRLAKAGTPIFTIPWFSVSSFGSDSSFLFAALFGSHLLLASGILKTVARSWTLSLFPCKWPALLCLSFLTNKSCLLSWCTFMQSYHKPRQMNHPRPSWVLSFLIVSLSFIALGVPQSVTCVSHSGYSRQHCFSRWSERPAVKVPAYALLCESHRALPVRGALRWWQ